jgi:hypothetical protein
VAEKKEQAKKKARKVTSLPAMPPAINICLNIESKILTGEECSKIVGRPHQSGLLYLVHEVQINGCSPVIISEPYAYEEITEDTKALILEALDYLARHAEGVVISAVGGLINESIVATQDEERRPADIVGAIDIVNQIFGTVFTEADSKSTMHYQIGGMAFAMLSRIIGRNKGYASHKSAKKIRLNPSQLQHINEQGFSYSYDKCAKARKIYEATNGIPKEIGSGSKGGEELDSLLWLNNYVITAKAKISCAMARLAMANNASCATIVGVAVATIRNRSAIANKRKPPFCETTKNAAACEA